MITDTGPGFTAVPRSETCVLPQPAEDLAGDEAEPARPEVVEKEGRVTPQRVGAAAKAGFETAIDVDMDVGSVRVRALDGEGRVFATSAVVSR